MRTLDWIVVGVYLVFHAVSACTSPAVARGPMADFFVSGRSLPWWLAGTSMAATTFSIDTPLYVVRPRRSAGRCR